MESLLDWIVDRREKVALGGAIVSVCTVGLVVRSYLKTRWWQRRIRKAEDGSRPDGPVPVLVVGNVPLLKRGFYEALYGYVKMPSSVFWVLSTPFVVVTELDSLRRVLGGDGGTYTKPKYFGYRSKTVSAAVASQKRAVEMESLEVDNEGDASRKALMKIAEGSFEQIWWSMGKLLERLTELNGEGGVDEAMWTVQSAVTRLNLEVLFQYKDDKKADETGGRILRAGREFAQQMIDPLRVLFRPWSALKFMLDALAIVRFGRELCRHVDAMAEDGKSNWVHAWIGKVGKVGKLGKVTGLLMASTQTVPLSALWTIHFVSEDLFVLKKLREEVRQVLGPDRDISQLTFADLDRMKYVESVVRETLRMRPPFPVLIREAQRDDKLAGLIVPKGTTVYIVPWLIHHSPLIWNEPDTFRPERFVEDLERGDASSSFAFIPFSRGARMCGGYRLALVELKVLLIRFVTEYDCTTDFLPAYQPGRFPNLSMDPRGIRVHLTRIV